MRSLPFHFLSLFAVLLTTQEPKSLPAQTTAAATRPLPAVVASPAPDAATADLVRFLERASALKNDDVEGRLALARWARDRHMWAQATEMAQAALFRDPGNRAAYLILQQADEAQTLPDEPQVEEVLKAEFEQRFMHPFKTRYSRHFLFCYDTTDAFAAQRGPAMERVYDAFQFYFNMNTLRPTFLEKRLVVILFKDRDDYLEYAKQTERADLSWSSGYYSQRSNRSAYFDDTSGPSAQSFTKQTDTLRATIDELSKKITAATSQGQTGLANQLSVERNRTHESMLLLTNRMTAGVQFMNNVKSMHEAAHQVAFNVGIQRRNIDYPLWFSEGLACSFEMEDSLGRRGPALVNFGRVPGVKDALKNNTLLPIDKFILQPREPDAGTIGIIYSEGWALFHYLYKYERAGMEKYLLSFKAGPRGRQMTADEQRTLFTNAFGEDVEALNKKFMAYLKTLPDRAP